MIEMSEPKKVVRNTPAIVLGIICILLAVGMVSVYVYQNNMYNALKSSSSSSSSSLNAQITNLKTWLSGNETALATANAQITTLTSQLANANAINSLQDSTVVANDKTVSQGNGAYSDFSLSASYAGYVSVDVQSSTVAGTWVEISYSSNGVSYSQAYTGNQAINVGSSAVFPVLPSSSITIGVGNGLSFLSSGATETVTITYYY